MADKLPQGQKVIVDLSHQNMALGDLVLRIGPLQVIQNNCQSLQVVSDRKELLSQAGIQQVISEDDLPRLLDGQEYVVPPPPWARVSAGYKQKMAERYHTHPHVIDGLLNCDYFADCVSPEERKKYPFLNRVTINFLKQIQEKTEFDFSPDELIPAYPTNPSLTDCLLPGRLLSDRLILAIGDKASAESKCWPHYAEVVDQLSQMRPDLHFAFVDLNTAFTTQVIEKLQFPDKVIYSAQRDDPGEATNFMVQARAYLGNDSGPGHYFSLVNHGRKPSLTLSARSNDPDRWAPNGLAVDFVYLNSQGHPRSKVQYEREEWQQARSANHKIGEIPVDLVIQKTLDLLPNSTGSIGEGRSNVYKSVSHSEQGVRNKCT